MGVPTIKLSSGHEMPQVGFGCWKVDNKVCADVIYNAIKTGYRLFDGACGKSCSGAPRSVFPFPLWGAMTRDVEGLRCVFGRGNN
jgi:hypothetical protein